MRVVFDTNIYISGFLFKGGIPSRLLELARDKHFELFFSPEILEEVRFVTRAKFGLSLNESDRILRWIEDCGQIVYAEEKLKLVKRCEPDNRILECALAASSNFLVTGDKKDLLSLKHNLSFKIISPRGFYELILSK